VQRYKINPNGDSPYRDYYTLLLLMGQIIDNYITGPAGSVQLMQVTAYREFYISELRI
jgi:hypothetical protein